MKDWFIPYVAGLTDGEGCITIGKTSPRRTHSANYRLEVIIVNNCLEPLTACRQQFGGNIRARTLPLSHQVHYAWEVVADQAYKFLQIVHPYLIIKKKQAELGMEFREAITFCIPAPGKKLPPDEIALREAYWQRMRQLNHSNKI